jgi:CxxC motif-containing protein (DUF1111 family)
MGLGGCDDMFTKLLLEGDDFEQSFDMLSADLNTTFALGEEAFIKVFTVEEGLGPIFNNTGCISCHPGNGRGTPDLALIRFSIGDDLVINMGGPQHQDKAIPGVPLEVLPAGVNKSRRLPPPIFGLGLIENIPVETILSYADESDADGDGISGRPNWVTAPHYVPSTEVGGGPGLQLGRFSRKAQVSSLIQQDAEAYQQDIGITNGFIPIENPHQQTGGLASVGDTVPDPEIDRLTVMETIVFLRLLSPPPRGEITSEVKRGEKLFDTIGCASCHVQTMQTGPHSINALNEVNAHIYSDLLLHDMGEELADNRPDGSATGREWRTAPLWGTRLVAEFLGGTPFFLHDGRATTLEGAIRAHGGEAQKAKETFFNLSEVNQQAVIAFLESL